MCVCVVWMEPAHIATRVIYVTASWQNVYKVGAAVQVWGTRPACNNETMCKDYQGKPACCTKDCQVERRCGCVSRTVVPRGGACFCTDA